MSVLSETIYNGRSEMFSDLYKPLEHFVTIPFTIRSCERAFFKTDYLLNQNQDQ